MRPPWPRCWTILDLLLKRDGVSRNDLDDLIEDVRHKLHHEHGDPMG